jgi:hypothetical protein
MEISQRDGGCRWQSSEKFFTLAATQLPLRLCVNSAFPISAFCFSAFQRFSVWFPVLVSSPVTRHASRVTRHSA